MSNEYIQANIELHTKLADVYKETEPHYRQENIERISGILKELRANTRKSSLLDIGCGQGFIIDIAKTYYQKIRGVDVTQSMLDKVNLYSGSGFDIKVSIGNAENLPFRDNEFDVCTAYAVLHHIYDISAVASEACRVLKPGGVFYSSLDPNFYYWDALRSLPDSVDHSEPIRGEMTNTLKKNEELSESYDISLEVVDRAEARKHIDGGFREEDLINWFNDAGFSSVVIEYDWFFGQGKYIHDHRLVDHVEAIDCYLRELLPISRSLYKYVSVFATK